MDDDLIQMELDLVNIKILTMETQIKAVVYQLQVLKKDDQTNEHVARMVKERRVSLDTGKQVISLLKRSKDILRG